MTESRKEKRKAKSSAVVVTAITLLGLGIAAPAAYTKVIVPKLDDRRYEEVLQEVDLLIENEYTGAIHEDVVAADLTSINAEIAKIKSKSKRSSLEKETNLVLEQVQVQTSAKSALKALQGKTKYEEINLEDVNKLIAAAGGIKNVNLRAEILREANIILERHQYATQVQKEVTELEVGDWPSIYTAEVNISSVEYAELRKTLLAKIAEVKKASEDERKAQTEEEKKATDEEVKAAEDVVLKEVTKGASTRGTVANRFEAAAVKYLSENKDIKLLLLHMEGTLYVYRKSATSLTGLDTLVYETLPSTTTLTTRETKNISYIKYRRGVTTPSSSSSSSSSVATMGDSDDVSSSMGEDTTTSSSSSSSSDLGSHITIGNMTAGSSSAHDIVLSSSTIAKIGEAINAVKSGEVAFYDQP